MHILAADIQYMVPGNYIALIVNGKAAVGVAVKGEANIKAVVEDEFLHLLNVCRAAVDVDIQAVRIVVYHICIGSESVKHAL